MAATSHSITSGTPTQTIGANMGDESTADYSSLDPIICKTSSTDSRRYYDGKNEVFLNEGNEFADIPCHLESNSGVSTEENIFPGELFQDEQYAHLKH